jgi:DNA-binding NtrC family response regulator
MENVKIIIVDDDVSIVQTIKEILELTGYDTETADTAKDGLEKIRRNDYNLALFDIMLPDMLGTELLAEAHKIKPKMKKIMVTGFASLENAVLALNSGADAYIMKPVNPENLLKVIEEKLIEQDKEDRMNEDKVSDWIEDRLNNLDT